MAAKQVIIKSEGTQIKANIANESITPGHLIEFIGGSAATASQLKKHATAGGNAQKRFALEQDYIGGTGTAGGALSKTYASGDEVNYLTAKTGDEINALIKASENVGVGSLLESNGDGTLRIHTPASAGAAPVQANRIVAMALDSSNVGTVARVRVEVV